MQLLFNGNAYELSKALGVSSATVSRWLNNKSKPSLNKNIFSTLEEFGINVDWLLSGVGEMFVDGSENKEKYSYALSLANSEEFSEVPTNEVKQFLGLPIYDVPVSALIGVGTSIEDLPFSYTQLSIGLKLDIENTKIFRVSGDSMISSGIQSGSHIIVDVSMPARDDKKIMANINGTLVVKKCKINKDGAMELYSQNGVEKLFPVSEYDNFQYIGLVRAIIEYM